MKVMLQLTMKERKKVQFDHSELVEGGPDAINYQDHSCIVTADVFNRCLYAITYSIGINFLDTIRSRCIMLYTEAGQSTNFERFLLQLRRHRSQSVDPSQSSVGLQCSGKDDSQSSNPKIVKLGTTQTSWQGWGSATTKKAELKVVCVNA